MSKDPRNPMPRSAKALLWLFGDAFASRRSTWTTLVFAMLGLLGAGVVIGLWLPLWAQIVAALGMAAGAVWAVWVAVVYLKSLNQ